LSLTPADLPASNAGEDDEHAPADSEQTWPEEDRRFHSDRRGQPTGAWSSLLGMRRRRSGRRDGETQDIYVDRFRPSDVVLLIGIFVLNIFDALFTLIWLQRGGGEANPIMNWMIGQGDDFFLIQKCIVVGLWLVFLVVHKNFRLARWGLYSMAGVYGLLILYHFALIASGLDPATARRAQDLEISAQPEHESRESSLDPEDSLAERHRSEPGSGETVELMLAPAALGPDRQGERPFQRSRALDGPARIGDQPPAAPDQSW